MPSLKDYGIELQSFAPIPNSIIVGRVKFGELDLNLLQQISREVCRAFYEQGGNNRVIFIPNDIALHRLSMAQLCQIRNDIDEIIKGCEN